MELVELGRNDPCPCGSGRKYKKCCLGARDAAIAGNADDLDVAALVDRAIETDDWSAVHALVDVAMEIFEAGGPLEHVRFHDDLFDAYGELEAEPARLCTAGWLAMFEREVAYVLTRHELEPAVRDALRMAAHLVRRFGAMSPIVEELAAVHADEADERSQRLLAAPASHGLGPDDMRAAGPRFEAWVERTRPPVLSFAQWFALRMTPEAALGDLWMSSVARRVCETCLDELDDASLDEPACWLGRAATTMRREAAPVADLLTHATPLRSPTAEEQRVYDALLGRQPFEDDVEHALLDLVRATEVRGDFADAALLRETLRLVQHRLRDRPRR